MTAIAKGSAFEFPAINGSTNRQQLLSDDGLTNFAAF